MSADNTIVILGTLLSTGEKVYRVAHIQAWDSFEWLKVNEPYNVGWYLSKVFPETPVFSSLEDAGKAAYDLRDEIGYVEYGVMIEETKYIFPED